MVELTPDLQAKLAKFRDAYEMALVWFADAGGNAERKERNAWKSAKREVPLSEVEEEFFRRLVIPDESDTDDLPTQSDLPHIRKPE